VPCGAFILFSCGYRGLSVKCWHAHAVEVSRRSLASALGFVVSRKYDSGI